MKMITAIIILFLLNGSYAFGKTKSEELQFGGNILSVQNVPLKDNGNVKYFATPWPDNTPLLVFIQGSGCQPVFVKNSKAVYSTVFGLINLVGRHDAGVLIVEKPFSAQQPVSGGGTQNCPPEFNQTFTLDSWSKAIKVAINDWQTRSKRRKLPIRLVGVSEGAVVAAKISGELKEIDRVALVGFSGSTQAYDEVLSTYHSESTIEQKSSKLKEIGEAISEVMNDPKNSQKFYRGHPYLRWSSFFSADPTLMLEKSKAKILMVSGTDDNSVPIESTERAWITLVVNGRDVEFRRVLKASHSLVSPGDTGFDGANLHLIEIVNWILDGSTSDHNEIKDKGDL